MHAPSDTHEMTTEADKIIGGSDGDLVIWKEGNITSEEFSIKSLRDDHDVISSTVGEEDLWGHCAVCAFVNITSNSGAMMTNGSNARHLRWAVVQRPLRFAVEQWMLLASHLCFIIKCLWCQIANE